MADSDSLIFPSKKRKLEEENYEEPLLEPPLQENLLPESQLSGSQTVVTDIFDLTLVEQESEKLEDRFVWKKIELQSVTSMLQKLDRSMYEVPENFSVKFDEEGKYLGKVRCSNHKCQSFISRDLSSKKNLNLKLSHLMQHIRNHHKTKKNVIHPAFRPKKPPTVTETSKREVLASECSILSKFKLPMNFFQRPEIKERDKLIMKSVGMNEAAVDQFFNSSPYAMKEQMKSNAEKEKVVSDADNLGKALCAKIFSMCFGSFWTPNKNGGVSGLVQSPASEPQRVTDVHILAAFLHRPSRTLKLHRMTKALRERDDDEFFKKNRVLIETKIRDWHERAIEKLRVLAENTEENSRQIFGVRPCTKEISDSDLFDDDDNFEEELREEHPLSDLDREIQIYMNLSKEKYVVWRNSHSTPKHNVESIYFRRFWEDHKLMMPILSQISLKIARLSSSSNEAEREFSCLSYQMGPSYMNQKAAHIEKKQQTAEFDRFKKALTKIVMQKEIESRALGVSKSTA